MEANVIPSHDEPMTVSRSGKAHQSSESKALFGAVHSLLRDTLTNHPRLSTYEELRRALPRVVEMIADMQADGDLSADDASDLIRIFASRVFEAHLTEQLSAIFGGLTEVEDQLSRGFNFSRTISYE